MRRRAFTLFEVLMALGIFGIAVVGMLMALNSALSSASEVRISETIRTQVENRMAMLEFEKAQNLERTFETKSPKIRFIESVRPEKVVGKNKENLNGFWRVRIVAKYYLGGEDREEEVTFLRYSP